MLQSTPQRRFSNTLSLGKMFVRWKLRDNPRRLISYGASPLMRWPFSSTSPLLGTKRPLIRLNSVDLPAPLGPMMAPRSPGATAKLAPRMISVLPKLLRRSRSSSAGPASFAPMAGASLLVRMFDFFLNPAPAAHKPAAAQFKQTEARDHHQAGAGPTPRAVVPPPPQPPRPRTPPQARPPPPRAPGPRGAPLPNPARPQFHKDGPAHAAGRIH